MTNILLSYQSTHGHLYSPASCRMTGNSDSFFQTLAEQRVDGGKETPMTEEERYPHRECMSVKADLV